MGLKKATAPPAAAPVVGDDEDDFSDDAVGLEWRRSREKQALKKAGKGKNALVGSLVGWS
jgi:hypothetical protein